MHKLTFRESAKTGFSGSNHERVNVKKQIFWRAFGLMASVIVLCSAATVAQEDRGDWSLTGADAGQTGWQKNESILTPDSVPSSFKFLWKIKLGQASKADRSFSEPLLAGRLINAQGFKDIVYWSSADTLYAVDSELGTLIWKKQFGDNLIVGVAHSFGFQGAGGSGGLGPGELYGSITPGYSGGGQGGPGA